MGKIILVDMDGVMVDFISGACGLWGEDGLPEHWPLGVKGAQQALGLTDDDFWERIDSAGIGFWANLAEYDWFADFDFLLRSLGEVYYLSSPSRSVNSIAGKKIWLDKRFGSAFRNFIFTPAKRLLAGPDRILIDDYERHCREFVLAGGTAFLFGRPWNAKHAGEGMDGWQEVQRILKAIRELS